MNLKELGFVFLGGGLGSCVRFLLNKSLPNLSFIPLGTLSANFISCIIFGFFFLYTLQKIELSPTTNLFILTGFCGGLSTFSTFSFETVQLLKSSEYTLAMSNVLINLSLSIIGLFIGMFLVKYT